MQNKKSVRKVLLVDDDADDRKYFEKALHEIDASIECATAKDGQLALASLENTAESLPDFIFLDLRMPKVSGRQCLLKIKSSERLKHIPVIIYTTSKEVRESEELQILGAVHFISKPTNPQEIYYMLSMVLEERWGGAIEKNDG